MTEAQFQAEMSRLSRTFGEKGYSTERATLIWREVGLLPSDLFARVVDTLIGECRQPPLLPEIRDAVSRERDRQRSREPSTDAGKPWDLPHDCTYCFDTGILLGERIVRESQGGPYAFRCACEAGRRSERTQIPFFTSGHSQAFVYYDIKRRRGPALAVIPESQSLADPSLIHETEPAREGQASSVSRTVTQGQDK